MSLLVLSIPAGLGVADETEQKDPVNALEEEETLKEYDRGGRVTADMYESQERIVYVSVAEKADDVGYEEFVLDSTNDFLKVEYDDIIDGESEEVEFLVPTDYFDPRPKEDLEPLEGNETADLERVTVDGEEYTQVTVEFEERGSVVYPIDKMAGTIFSVRSSAKDTIANATGMPTMSSAETWEEVTINEGKIDNETTIVDTKIGDENATEIHVVYEPDRPVPVGDKIPVPKCNTKADIDDVCIEEEEGPHAHILFKNLDEQRENPKVYYRHKVGMMDETVLTVNDMSQIPTRMKSLTGSGGGGGE
ncbi:hypothetical protein [Natronococcus wangiae]|uniref:hypothetical protein n=1 Tax=Natronococcus wangiae TaxID=3068275 RepID=UPI00273CFC89|nr:hypothetical protein [Natronococcus sp. AD5]